MKKSLLLSFAVFCLCTTALAQENSGPLALNGNTWQKIKSASFSLNTTDSRNFGINEGAAFSVSYFKKKLGYRIGLSAKFFEANVPFREKLLNEIPSLRSELPYMETQSGKDMSFNFSGGISHAAGSLWNSRVSFISYACLGVEIGIIEDRNYIFSENEEPVQYLLVVSNLSTSENEFFPYAFTTKLGGDFFFPLFNGLLFSLGAEFSYAFYNFPATYLLDEEPPPSWKGYDDTIKTWFGQPSLLVKAGINIVR